MKANYQRRYDYSEIDIDSSWTSEIYENRHSVDFGITFIFTGTPVGEFFVDASNDKTVWIPLEFDEGQILAEGSAGNHAVTVKDFPFSYFRLRYVASSGSGSLNASLQIKAS